MGQTVFFQKHMVAIHAPIATFDGEMFPMTWLDNAIQLKYRCNDTGNVLKGGLLIVSDLAPEMIMIYDQNLTELFE